MGSRFWVETLGCPKNQVDSDKLVGVLEADGYAAADDPTDADLVVVNTCAFVEEARQESIDTILASRDRRAPGAKLVVTGCMAERYGDELAQALPEVDLVAALRGAGHARAHARAIAAVPVLRPAGAAPAAGHRPVGLREGGRGLRPGVRLLRHPQLPGPAALPHGRVDPGRGRRPGRPRDRARGPGPGPLRAATRVRGPRPSCRSSPRSPSGSTGCACSTSTRPTWTTALIDAVLATGVPYFDLSLQHVSRPLLRRMRRWGDGDRFRSTHRVHPGQASRRPRSAPTSSSGYPGETEEDHDRLLRLRRGRPARLVRLLLLLRGGGHLRRRPRRHGRRRRSWPSACAELGELQDAHHRRPPGRPDRVAGSRSSSTSRASAGPTARHRRSTASCW